MGVQGADLDGLGRLKSTFERQSGTLQAIMGGASTGVAALDQLWVGSDAGQFRTTWTNVHQRALAAAMRALAEAADTVERNRRAQETASAADGVGAGGLGPAAPPVAYQGAAPGNVVPPRRPTEEIFTEDYMNDFIGRRVRGEDSPELNALLEAVLADDGSDPARLQANLDRIADIRGVDRDGFRAQYATYQELLAVDAARGEGGPSIDLNRHGDFLGSTASLRYGSVIGEVYGIDPVFGALLNPTGGLVGGGDNAYNPGENDAVGYHGIFHDAAGYLYNHQGVGPGYDYLGREGSDTRDPKNGQIGGISWWVGNHPQLDADLSQVTALAGEDVDPRLVAGARVLHAAGAEEILGQGITIAEGVNHIGQGAYDVARGHPTGLGEVAQGTGNIAIGAVDTVYDLGVKRVDYFADGAQLTADHVEDGLQVAGGAVADGLESAGGFLVDHADALGGPFVVPGLFG